MAESFDEHILVRKSKTLIDAFDLVKMAAEKVGEQMERVDEIRSKLCKKANFRCLRKFLHQQRRKKHNKIVLAQADKKRKMRLKL